MYSIYLIIFYLLLVAIRPTRRLALALLPWLVFACSYDAMRIVPNYEVNPIDTQGLYDAEKSLFGIASASGGILIPGEYFALHHSSLADFLAGLFYLCWVPVPLFFSIYLYFKGEEKHFLQFSFAFLFINILGFIGYYIHPAAPPWYVMQYGFDPVLNTPGNVAGLSRFDALIGLPVFQSIYGKNANVFAAVPSLHATYMLVTTYYAVKSRQHKLTIIAFAIICIGIWWTAVYSTHHYVIDVLLGIATAIIGISFLELLVYRNAKVERFIDRYATFINPYRK